MAAKKPDPPPTCQWNPILGQPAGRAPTDCRHPRQVKVGDLLLCERCAALPEHFLAPRVPLPGAKSSLFCLTCGTPLEELVGGGCCCPMCCKLRLVDVVRGLYDFDGLPFG